MRAAVLVAGVALAAGQASAGSVTFDFSGLATWNPSVAMTPYGAPGAFTSLAMVKSGVGATISRTGDGGVTPSLSKFDVINIAGASNWAQPAGWGTEFLDPFHYYWASNGAVVSPASDKFVVDLVAPAGKIITGVSIEYGDYGEGDGDARFQAYSGASGTGSLIADLTQLWNGSFVVRPGYPVAAVPGQFSFSGASPIASIVFWGENDPGNNTLFWDNLEITYTDAPVIPLPHAGGMALAGLGLVAMRRRRVA